MLYEDFRSAVQAILSRRYADKARVTLHRVAKNNGESREAVCVHFPGEKTAPLLYLDTFFPLYEQGRSPEEIADVMQQAVAENRKIPIDIPELSDWGQVRDRIGLKLISRDMNRELLERVPSEPVLDLAAVCYVYFVSGGDTSASAVVTEEHRLGWGVTAEELFARARENARTLFAPDAGPMEEMIASFLGEDTGGGDCESDRVPSAVPMYVVTNRQRYLGASAILVPGVLDRILEKENWGACYVVPSSVHEMLLLPWALADAGQVREIIRCVNEEAVSPAERLSYSLYLYDGTRRALGIADVQEPTEWYYLRP